MLKNEDAEALARRGPCLCRLRQRRWLNDPASIDSAPIGYITLADPSFANGTTNLRGWNTGGIFTGYSDLDPLATRQTVWSATRSIYFSSTAIRIAVLAGCRGIIVHDGYNGQQYPHPVSYLADPSFFQPEAPQSAVQAAVNQIVAAGLQAGTIIRPTVWDNTGVASGAYGQPYGPDSVATVRAKLAAWYGMGGRMIYFDSSVSNETETLFTTAQVQGWLDEFPGITILFEWYNGLFAGMPGVRALHQPTPGGYLRVGGMQETPEWDPNGSYWLSTTTDDPADASDIARLSAAYQRGAQLYLYCGSGVYEAWTLAHAALWRAQYVAP